MKNIKISRYGSLDDNFDEPLFEKIRTKKKKDESIPRERRSIENNDGFNCRSCKSWVSATREACGVNHRNHCPFCLVSLHVDQAKAGDRLSDCRSRMEAIGLTFKKIFKRYPQEDQGELMLIHQCTGCGKIDINRIAADDNPELLYALCKTSLNITDELSGELARQGINSVDAGGFNAAYAQIYGREPIEVELAGVSVGSLIQE